MGLLDWLRPRNARPEPGPTPEPAACPPDPVDIFRQGTAALAAGREPEAIAAFRRAVALAPAYAEAYHGLGRLFDARGDLSEAEAQYRAALGAAPAYAEAHFSLATLLERKDDAEGADLCYRAALDAAPAYAEAWYRRGRLLERLGRADQALDCYTRACTLEPRYFQCWQAALTLIRDRGLSEHPLLNRLFGYYDAHIENLIRSDETTIVWFHQRIERIGHLTTDSEIFQGVFGTSYDRILILCKPRRFAANTALFDIAMRGRTVVEVEDDVLETLGSLLTATFTRGNVTYYLCGSDGYQRAFSALPADRLATFKYLALTPSERERGDILARQLGVFDTDKIVTLHVRQRGYLEAIALKGRDLGGMVEDYSTFRNSTIEIYLPAIRYLVERGYVVVRTGDPTMTRLPPLGPRVIDLPFVEDRDPLLDAYFAARCDFMVGSSSGASSVAEMFRRPLVHINGNYESLSCNHYGPLIIYSFKKIFRERDGVRSYLSMEEIFKNDLDSAMYSSMFESMHLHHEDMSSDEIVAVCQEMIDLVARDRVIPSPEQEAFFDICRTYRSASRSSSSLQATEYGKVDRHQAVLISAAFCRLNPFFLERR